MQKSFSVVTPNYNMSTYLEETIDSVLSNLQNGDEYFIIDGGSTDESLEIISKYARFLTAWVSEKDSGYAHALKKGFYQSNGVNLSWINSGDLLLKGALDKARTILSGDVDFIFGDDLYIDNSGIVLQVTNGGVSSLKSYMLNGGWTPLQDACFWRRDLYEKVGGINAELKNAADYDLFLRMSLHGNCKYAPNIFSAFRRHEGQKSINNMTEYKRERSNSRRLQLDIAYSIDPFYKIFITFIYWFKVRCRVRFFEKKSNSSAFEGLSVSKIHAQ